MKKLPFIFFLASVITVTAYGQSLKNDTMYAISQTELLEHRFFFNSLGSLYPASEKIKIEYENIAGTNCYWFNPDNAPSDKIIIYLHGGSFALGSIQSHKAMLSHFTEKFGIKILFVEYALAPEHPYPAGINSLLDVYRFITANYKFAKLILMGDSAGGGLLVSAMETIQQEKLKLPTGIIMISPWLNFESNRPSYELNKKTDRIITKEYLKKFAYYYAGNRINEANPFNIKFHEFPPVLILVGSNEIILDDSRDFIEEIKKIQNDSKVSIYNNENHVWLLSDIRSDGSKKALFEMKNFIQRL